MEYVDEDGEGFVCSLDASVDAAVLGEVSVMPSPSRPVIKNVVPVDCAAHKIDQGLPDTLLEHDQDCMDHYMGRRSCGHHRFVLSRHHIEDHLLQLHYLVLYLCLCLQYVVVHIVLFFRLLSCLSICWDGTSFHLCCFVLPIVKVVVFLLL